MKWTVYLYKYGNFDCIEVKIEDGNEQYKEYYSNGILAYECDYNKYVTGKRNGKCKEYYENGKLKFEGEFDNGQKNGKCKEYNKNGKLIYEGEYLNGQKNENG